MVFVRIYAIFLNEFSKQNNNLLDEVFHNPI